MPAYRTLSLDGLLEALSSASPVPGGGSAAALAGATGVSLLLMVARIPRTRTGIPIDESGLGAAAARLLPLREAPTALLDRDVVAYEAVLAASRPRSGSAPGGPALQPALLEATATQMDVLRACRDALREALPVTAHGVRSALADMQVAIGLLQASAHGASVTVEANLALVDDGAATRTLVEERSVLVAEIGELADRGRGQLSS